MSRLALLLPLVAALLFAACSTSLYKPEDSTPQWVSQRISNGPPRRDFFEMCHLALVRAGFPPGDNDVALGVVTSGWDVNLAPYSFKGTREQGIVEIQKLEGSGNYELRARVRKEINIEQVNTLEESLARWDPGADNTTRARTVLQHIKSQLP